jgi:hypothetical protein
MKTLSLTQVAYHLTLTKGTVKNGSIEFQTIPLICLTGLIFRLIQLVEMIEPTLTIVEKINTLGKCLTIGFNSLTWAFLC